MQAPNTPSRALTHRTQTDAESLWASLGLRRRREHEAIGIEAACTPGAGRACSPHQRRSSAPAARQRPRRTRGGRVGQWPGPSRRVPLRRAQRSREHGTPLGTGSRGEGREHGMRPRLPTTPHATPDGAGAPRSMSAPERARHMILSSTRWRSSSGDTAGYTDRRGGSVGCHQQFGKLCSPRVARGVDSATNSTVTSPSHLAAASPGAATRAGACAPPSARSRPRACPSTSAPSSRGA